MGSDGLAGWRLEANGRDGHRPVRDLMKPGNVFDRRRGAVVGLAVGDALGAAVEFRPPGTFPPVTGYRGGGPHGLDPGEWTDDTSMALALADSILEAGWDIDDQAPRYLRWYRQGEYSVNGRCFDIGNATRQALSEYAATGDASTSGSDSRRSAGNGSIMRLAPVPAAYTESDPGMVVRLCVESSLPTHRAPQCLSACAVMGAILHGLMLGAERETVTDPEGKILGPVFEAMTVDPEIGAIFGRSDPVVGSGYVVESLRAALWAFATSQGFEEAVLKAVNLGDDADTTGAVCGQLAGAYWGYSSIPQPLISGLARHDLIDGYAQRLAGLHR